MFNKNKEQNNSQMPQNINNSNQKSSSLLSKKIKASIRNQKQYKIFESKQFIGLILLVVFSFLFVVSIVQVRGLSTINSYTIGMLFGYYSYFIYIGFIVLGLCFLFQIDVKIDKFLSAKFKRKFHFSWVPYLFFSLGVALFVESIMKAIHGHTIFPGGGAFKQFFSDWWKNFTNDYGKEPGSTSLLPGIMNSGIVVALFMSLLVSWSGYIVSIIIGLLFIAHFIYYIFYGSLIKRIRIKMFGDPNKKDVIKKEEFKEYETKIMDLSFEDNSGMIEKPNMEILSNVNAKTTTISIDPDNIYPVENPLDNIEKNEMDFVEEKTNQINLEKNLTQEFKIEIPDEDEHKDIETFDFELDIFGNTEEAKFEEDDRRLTDTNIEEINQK